MSKIKKLIGTNENRVMSLHNVPHIENIEKRPTSPIAKPGIASHARMFIIFLVFSIDKY